MVAEKRELKTKADGRVWAWVVKVCGMGMTSEVMIPEDLYRLVGEGELIRVTGRIEQNGNRMQLTGTKIDTPSDKPQATTNAKG
jgi:hypothetical protein